jgi:hypothetical protein
MTNRLKNLILGGLIAGLGAGVGMCASSAEPLTVHWSSYPVGPDETVLVKGSGLYDGIAIFARRLTDRGAGAARQAEEAELLDRGIVDRMFGRNWKPMDVIQPNGTDVKFTIPRDWDQGVFAFKVVAGDQTVVTTINSPDVWWIQGDEGTNQKQFDEYDPSSREARCTAGGWLRANGRMLFFEGREAKGALIDREGKTVPLTTQTFRDTYSIGFDVPETVEKGEYDFYVHSGAGGQFGWTDAGRVTVVDEMTADWPKKVFNVRDYGADGGHCGWWGAIPHEAWPAGAGQKFYEWFREKWGVTKAVNQALADIRENGGGVLYFPAGRYVLDEMLELPPRTVLRGDGKGLTHLDWNDMPEPPRALILGSNNFVVEDLSIWAINHVAGIAGDFGNLKDAGNIRIRRVGLNLNRFVNLWFAWRHYGAKAPEMFRVRMQEEGGGGTPALRSGAIQVGGRNVQITDNYFNTASSFWLWVHQIQGGYIARNRAPITEQYWIIGCNAMIVEDNNISGGGGTISTHSTPQGRITDADYGPTGNNMMNHYCRDIYFSHNTINDNLTHDREAMTHDVHGSPVYFKGNIVKSQGKTLVFPEGASLGGVGCDVVILDGRGRGQYRTVMATDHERRTMTLDRKWDVAPDTGSTVSIQRGMSRSLFIGNHMENTGSVFQLNGCDLIAARNYGNNAGPIHNMDIYAARGFVNVQILDNHAESGMGWGAAYMYVRGNHFGMSAIQGSDGYGGARVFGTVLRNNRFDSATRINVAGQIEGAVIEGNMIKNAPWGIMVSTGRWPAYPNVGVEAEKFDSPYPASVLIRKNEFENVKDKYLGDRINESSNRIVE